MPHEVMNEQQVAAYLHMDLRNVLKLASRGQLPCRKIAGKYQFLKAEVDHWVEAQMHKLPRERLAGIERGVSVHHGLQTHEEPLVVPLIPQGGIAMPLEARTRDAVVRSLVDLADAAGLVYNRDELIEEVIQREQLCSTAMIPALAMPHPRHPLPYDIAASFIVAGVTSSGIPFGAIDGTLTRLFFLICCKDERTHLHVLARLARMFHDPDTAGELIAAGDADDFREILRRHENVAMGLT